MVNIVPLPITLTPSRRLGRLTGFLLALFFAPLVLAADIQVNIDRNPVSLNESFQVTFITQGSADGDPDFSPLEEDFDIVNRQQSRNLSWGTGMSGSDETRWVLTLMAKRSGRLLLPAIAFGSDSSQPLTVTVNKAADPGHNDDELFMEVEAAPENPYVQSQVLYTLRFYRRIQITQASLSEPEAPNAVVEKLTEDITYNTRINGVLYAVTERKYAIFPQQSGLLNIPPLELTAQVISHGRSRFNGLFGSQATKTRRVTSRPMTLNVRPAPASAKGSYWLPAELVHLEQQWSDASLQVKVGEPLTRTLTLLVKGATVGQLPELWSGTNIDQVKSYPDQPLLNEQKSADGITALREEKIAFIPSRPGKYELPAIVIPWFNSKTGKMEIAEVPAVTLTAIAAPASSPAPAAATPSAEEGAVEKAAPVTPPAAPAVNVWMWVSLFLALAWLLTLLFMLRRRSRQTVPETDAADSDGERVTLKTLSKALKTACNDNDAQTAKQILMEWAGRQFGTASLGAAAPYCEARLREEILHLNECLYSADKNAWDGKKLFQAFTEHNARAQIKRPEKEPLEPLFRI